MPLISVYRALTKDNQLDNLKCILKSCLLQVRECYFSWVSMCHDFVGRKDQETENNIKPAKQGRERDST
jgi:hypothetical protein